MLNNQEIITSCLNKWQHEDERTQYFSDTFDVWIANIPPTAHEMICHLLSGFCYYPHKIVNHYLVELHKTLILQGKITEDNTIYISIKSNTGIGNSSNDYWVEYKLQNKINKYCCIDDIRQLLPEQRSCISNIIIIDDCSGSGNTLTKYLEKNLDFFIGKNIYFITIHIMKAAIDYINLFAQEKNLTIHNLFMFSQDKAFNDKFFEDKAFLKKAFIKISKDLAINNNHILGYQESEGLFAFYNNTPNNTLGIFRYDTEKQRSLFPRRDDRKPTWFYFREQQRNRKKQNYYCRKNVNE